jgi:hypothetical protein
MNFAHNAQKIDRELKEAARESQSSWLDFCGLKAKMVAR